MNISLNEDLIQLCHKFHSGKISQAEYRLERRKALEQLSLEAEGHLSPSFPLIKRVGGVLLLFVGIVFVALMIGTFF